MDRTHLKTLLIGNWAHQWKVKAASLTCSAERISPTFKTSTAEYKQGNLYKRSGHSHKLEKIQQQSLYANKKPHPLLLSPTLIYWSIFPPSWNIFLRHFTLVTISNLPFRQQVRTLGKLYREKQCFLRIQSCLLPPISYRNFRKHRFLQHSPFSMQNYAFGTNVSSCTWSLLNISQLLGAIGSYYTTKKHSYFPQNLWGIGSPVEICVLI